jgi:hypothetical protein
MLSRLLGAVVLLGATFAVPISPATAATSHTENLAAIIVADHNEARVAAGLAPLSMLPSLADFANTNSATMASTQSLTHTDLNEVMDEFPGATWAGENTVTMFDPATTATAVWLGSEGHAETLMAPFATHVFASVSCSADGRLWASVILMENVSAPRVPPPGPTSTTPADSRCARPVEPFRSSPDFVAQQYRDFLGREPDQTGIDYWVTEMENQRVTPTALMAAFMNSAEFGGRIAPAVRVHMATTGDLPSAQALRLSLTSANNGQTLEQLANELLASDAGIETFGEVDNETFVIELYNLLFERRPTANEVASAVSALENISSRGALVAQFANDAEYRDGSYAEVQVYIAYAAMLLRAPDSEGLAYWTQVVNDGGSIEALLDGLINSTEYRSRF